ncbi:uncharacterized protein LOC129091596 [Anoplopoma fimbria]|uniref:uncharacterized protein LOC129091596 n=1 Tax=Anoplopoma fimbria TaxID=229290 RepID=UPI0023ECCF0E|nr:uncharacterized protein LOC129091596 [Anoplopoma fimbria]
MGNEITKMRPKKRKMKIYPYVAGNTLNSHQAFLKKLTNKGATVVDAPVDSNVIIVFCPIVSRYKTDIDSALSSVPGNGSDEMILILVAMHHTFDKDYTLPRSESDSHAVKLHVDCLFFEKKGLLTCKCNANAVKMVCKQLHLGKYSKPKRGKKEAQDKKDLTNPE